MLRGHSPPRASGLRWLVLTLGALVLAVASMFAIADALDGVLEVEAAGGHATPIIDRFWFRSVYFREPSGVLFELATMGPGFDTDEDIEHLGEKLTLPPRFEPMRDKIEQILTPLPNPPVDLPDWLEDKRSNH